MSDARLTIVLPLKGKPDFTRRWLAYAAERLPYPVLVADGSLDADASPVVALCGGYARRGRPVEYVRYPYDADLSAFYEKLVDAVGRVRTPYVVLADNDDFFSPAGLRLCIEHLDAHARHTACGGRFIGFTLDDGGSERVRGRKISFDGDGSAFDLEEKTAAARVRAHFARYHPTWYDVHRTGLLRDALGVLRSANPKDIFLVELWTSFLPLTTGPIGRVAAPYLFRQRDTPGSQAATAAAKSGYLERARAPGWDADVTRLCADIASAVAAVDGTSAAEALVSVRAEFNAYLAATIDSEAGSRRAAAGRGRLKTALSSSPVGRAALGPLKAASAALRRLRARPLPAGDRAEADALRAFLQPLEKS